VEHENMKTLLVFYSRTGTTGKAAQDISKNFESDVEENVDLRKRMGFWDASEQFTMQPSRD
jgi:flavodoxin